MSTTRSEYREPKKPRSVCVYTIAQESKYIIVENVPNLGVVEQFIEYCGSFGKVEYYSILDNHNSSTEYSDVYLIQYDTINNARMAKRKMDDKPFYTNLLRVNYAPEYENLQDIRDKFQGRYQAVMERLASLNNKKRKKNKDNNNIYGPHIEQFINDTTAVNTITTTTTTITTTSESNHKKRRRI